MEHVLEQSCCLETYGFASCIGTGDDEESLTGGECDVEWDYGAWWSVWVKGILLPELEQEQRMG